jgi:cytochrome c
MFKKISLNKKIFFMFLFVLFALMIYFVYVSGPKISLAKGRVVTHPKTLKQALALGKHYYNTPLGASHFSCDTCHPGGGAGILGGKPTKPVIGAAVHYPTYKKWGKIITMQNQFNHCIYVGEEGFPKKIGSKVWKYLDLYVYSLSKGYKINVGK